MGMDFWGQVWQRVWEMAFFVLKLGLDLVPPPPPGPNARMRECWNRDANAIKLHEKPAKITIAHDLYLHISISKILKVVKEKILNKRS